MLQKKKMVDFLFKTVPEMPPLHSCAGLPSHPSPLLERLKKRLQPVLSSEGQPVNNEVRFWLAN